MIVPIGAISHQPFNIKVRTLGFAVLVPSHVVTDGDECLDLSGTWLHGHMQVLASTWHVSDTKGGVQEPEIISRCAKIAF